MGFIKNIKNGQPIEIPRVFRFIVEKHQTKQKELLIQDIEKYWDEDDELLYNNRAWNLGLVPFGGEYGYGSLKDEFDLKNIFLEDGVNLFDQTEFTRLSNLIAEQEKLKQEHPYYKDFEFIPLYKTLALESHEEKTVGGIVK